MYQGRGTSPAIEGHYLAMAGITGSRKEVVFGACQLKIQTKQNNAPLGPTLRIVSFNMPFKVTSGSSNLELSTLGAVGGDVDPGTGTRPWAQSPALLAQGLGIRGLPIGEARPRGLSGTDRNQAD